MHLQMMIDELSRRANESDLIALLATSRQARLYNAELARELRDVVMSLQKELDRRRSETHAEALPGRPELPTFPTDFTPFVKTRSSP